MGKFKVGDNVKISPKIDVYGMAGRFVNKIGKIKEINELNGGYEVAVIYIESMKQTAVVQTKHLDKA